MTSGRRRFLATTERVEELYDVRAAAQSSNEYGQEIKAAQTQVEQRTLVEGLLRQQGIRFMERMLFFIFKIALWSRQRC
jgi:hypothetical protein